MFNNSLDSILKSFTKIQTRLDTFAATEEAKGERLAEEEKLAAKQKLEAYDNAFTARKISGKINNLVSA